MSPGSLSLLWEVGDDVSEINVDAVFFFSQFLNDNFDYDEVAALEQLSAYGLKSFMFDVAKVIIVIIIFNRN